MTKYQSFADFDLVMCPMCDVLTEANWCEDCNGSHCKACNEIYGCD